MSQDDILKLVLGAIVSSSLIAGIVTSLINYYLNERREVKKERMKLYSEKIITIETFLIELSNALDKIYRIWNTSFFDGVLYENPEFLETWKKINELLDRFTQIFVLNAPFISFTDNTKNLRKLIENFVWDMESYSCQHHEDIQDQTIFYIGDERAKDSYKEVMKVIEYLNRNLYGLRTGEQVVPQKILPFPIPDYRRKYREYNKYLNTLKKSAEKKD